MQTLTRTATINGANPLIIDVESCTTSGFAGLQLVGTTSELLRDGKERAKTALERLGFKLGHKRILINLAPADLRKEGNHFDLPIALSLACLASDKAPLHAVSEYLFAAEISLDGELRAIRATVPLALMAIKNGLKGIVLPRVNAPEIHTMQRLFKGASSELQYLYFDHLKEVLAWMFEGSAPSSEPQPECAKAEDLKLNFDDMHLSPELQELAVCCAAGRHSLLLRGSPGTGKSMFMTRLPSILPSMSLDQHFECLKTYSILQRHVPNSILSGHPPFRRPHHCSSPQAILGTACEPGDIGLAHGGILFLDELPEFRRDLLEALREPLESGIVHVSRAQQKSIWQADIQFMAACNNCPCGWYGSSRQLCRCPSNRLLAYRAKLSGPILDRIDIHFNMPEAEHSALELFADKNEVGKGQTRKLRDEVERCLEFSASRSESLSIRRNTQISAEQMPAASGCDTRQFKALLALLLPMRLSNRANLRCLRVARSLADHQQEGSVRSEHVKQAAAWQARASAREFGESSL